MLGGRVPTPTGNIQKILDSLDVPREVKAQAWDAFHASRNAGEFKLAFDKLSIPQSAKADLWDLKAFTADQNPAPVTSPAAPVESQSLVDKVGQYMPSARTAFRVGGGAIGGAIGAGGGTIASAPTIAGTPIGAVGGAAIGGSAGAAAGESLYQMIQRLRGADSPQSAGEAAQALATAAGQGAFQEVIPAAITAKLPGALQRGSVETVGRLARAGPEGERAVVREVAKDAIPNIKVSGSDAGVLKQWQSQLAQASHELERAYNAVPQNTKFKSGPFVGALQGLRDKLLVNGKIPPGAKPQVDAYDEMLEWFTSNPSFSIADLRRNKQIWDNLVKWTRSSLSKEPAKEQAYEEGANLIRAMIAGPFPKIAAANRQVHTWKTLVDSLSRADTKQFGTMSARLGDLAPAVVGAGIGTALGGPAGGGLGATAGVLIRELVQTAAWKTASIPARQFAIQAIQRGDVQAAVKALSAGAVQAGTKVTIDR